MQAEIAQHRGPLPAALTKRLLETYQIPQIRSAIAQTADEAVRLAHSIGYPLVAKILSPDIPHRTEIGAVQLDIATPDALRAAIATIDANVRRANPRAASKATNCRDSSPVGSRSWPG